MGSPIGRLGFFDTIETFGTAHPNERQYWCGRVVEWYFDWGQQAYMTLNGLTPDQTVPLEKIPQVEQQSSLQKTCRVVSTIFKILCELTIFLPVTLGMLFAKFVYREQNRFSIQERPSPEQAERIRNIIEGNEINEEMDSISFEDVDGWKAVISTLQKIEMQRAAIENIRNRSLIFLSNEEVQELNTAITVISERIRRIHEMIGENRAAILDNFFLIHLQLEQNVQDAIENKYQIEVEAWEELQTNHDFMDRFHDVLRVQKKGQNWVKLEESAKTKEVLLYPNNFFSTLNAKIVPKGILNLGATCFINASLQALFLIPLFREKIRDENLPVIDSIQKNLKNKLEIYHGDDAANITNNIYLAWNHLTLSDLKTRSEKLDRKMLRDRIDKLINLKQGQSEKAKELESRLIKYISNNLTDECTALIGDGEKIDWKRVQEVLRFLTTAITDSEYIKYKRMIIVLREFVLKYEEPNVKPADFKAVAIKLREAFHLAFPGEGELRGQHDPTVFLQYVLDAIGYVFPLGMTRTGGKNGDGYSRKVTEPTQLLQVPIEGVSKVSLQHLLNGVMSVAINDAEWRPTDDHNNEIGNYDVFTEKTSIGGPPPKYLPLHIKRFEQTPSGQPKKITSLITFEKDNEVDLTGLFEDLDENEKVIYQVKAALIHTAFLGGGHYYTVEKVGKKWYKCNDSGASVIEDPSQELAQGYVYFLERKDD